MRHGSEFSVATAVEYEMLADAFLGVVKEYGTLECTRESGELVRFNPRLEYFQYNCRQ